LPKTIGSFYTVCAAKLQAGIPEKLTGIPEKLTGIPEKLAGVPEKLAGVPEKLAGRFSHLIFPRIAGTVFQVNEGEKQLPALNFRCENLCVRSSILSGRPSVKEGFVVEEAGTG
jgi:hypothetical protein